MIKVGMALVLLPGLLIAQFGQPSYVDNDFFTNVQRGLVPGVSAVLKFGRNSDADTATEDVWSVGGTFSLFPDDSTVTMVSTSGSDSIASAGAYSVTVEGLDSSWTAASETAVITGTAAVTLTNAYMIIHRALVDSTQGTNNVGTITFSSPGGVTMAQIDAGQGQTLMAIYGVPAGKTALLYFNFGMINSGSAAGTQANVFIYVKPYQRALNIKHFTGMVDNGDSHYTHRFPFPLVVQEKSLIKMSVLPDRADADISAGFDLLLFDEPTRRNPQ